MEYGLIGGKLGHSFSKPIHELVGGYDYQLVPLPTEDQAREFLEKREFRGINVTIPYKKLVIPYCHWVAPQAAAIGAVNCLVNREGNLYGYNTDYSGFCYLLDAHGIDLKDRVVLILGSGATHNTLTAVCKDRQAREILTAGRRGGEGILTYDQAAQRTDVQVILNASPAGMYPDNGSCLLDISRMEKLEGVADCVYNPFSTRLVLEAQKRGITAVGGFEMLVAQAVYAAQLFMDKELDPDIIPRTVSRLRGELCNVSLVGMPSCGKSTIGHRLAKALGKTFVDLDDEIEKEAGKPIPEIFAQGGEDAFRALETQVTARVTKGQNQVISTGGGIVTREENIPLLRQNGPVIWIRRPLDQLSVGGYRPLSKSPEVLAQMEEQRTPLYRGAADGILDNQGGLDQVLAQALELCRSLF